MGLTVDDRWLWLGFGVFFLVAARSVAYGLQDIVTLNEVHDTEYAKSTSEAEIEDSVPSKSLDTLYKSPNPEISKAATSLLLKRFCNIQDVDEWISDIFSPSIATRRSAEKLLRIYDSTSAKKPDIVYLRGLISHLTFDGSTENGTYQTIKSAYSSACNLRADGHMNAWNSLRSLSLFLERHADHQRRRGEAEVRNSDEMPFIVVPELSERTVEPWALAQRTLFTVHDPASRSRVKETFMRWYTAESGEYTINDQRQPDRHELIDPRDAMERFGGNYFAHGDARNDSPALWGRTARFHEESPEEAEVRRRRREAVVFHEGSGSIEQEDIFQRQLPTWQEPLDHQEQTRWEQVVERMA